MSSTTTVSGDRLALAKAVVLVCTAGGIALGVVAIWGESVFGSYLKAEIIGTRGLLLLGRKIAADFLVLGAIVVLGWRAKRISRALVLAAVAFFTLVNYAQWRSAATSSETLTPALLRMVGLQEYALTPEVLLTAATTVLATVVIVGAALRLFSIAHLPERPRFIAASCAFVAAALLGAPSRDDAKRRSISATVSRLPLRSGRLPRR